MKQPLLILTVVTLGAVSAPVLAASYPLCGVLDPLAGLRSKAPEPAPGLIQVQARHASLGPGGIARLRGAVHARRRGGELFADSARYNRKRQYLDATGNVIFLGQLVDASGHTAQLNLATHRSVIHRARFYLRDRQGRGSARRITLQNSNLGILTHVNYTSCAVGHHDWVLHSRRMVLNRRADEGTAHDVTLWFQGVPILYTPYLSFPLSNRRKTGFLAPHIGGSGKTGFDLATPFYWNIAPNQDATLTPRIMSRRGIQLRTQYRYLTRSSRGQIGLDYVPHDRVYGSSRYLLGVQDSTRLSRHWTAALHYRDVSDPYYFQDLGGSLIAASTRMLDRRASLTYASQAWSLQMEAQDFQLADPTLTSADQPLQRLPRVLLQTRYPPTLGPVHWDLRSEAVRFAQQQMTEADRFDTELGLGLPLDRPGFYIHPRLAYRYTAYDIARRLRATDPALTRSHPARGAPIASLDTQLFFERPLRLGKHDLVQTLQPRLYYLYVPYRQQNDLPVLDTSVPEFSVLQLFSENRFTGTDRLGDANRITAMLSSRVLDPATGTQYVDAGIGQIYYFHRRRVTLPGQTIPPGTTSNLLGRAQIDLSRALSARTDIEWDPRTHRAVRTLASIAYHSGHGRILNLAYRQRSESLNEPLRQTDISVLWPLSSQWSTVARWNYSLRDRRTLEALAGLQYESCCWALQVVARRYVSGTGGSVNTGLYLELQLKGLTRLGNGVQGLLENDILGYHPR